MGPVFIERHITYTGAMLQSTALKILQTGANVFLTGEPGSGKTYVVNAYVKWLREHGVNVAITASTGIAATHIGGMTIHAWTGIGVKKYLSGYDLDAISSNERVAKRIRAARVLIIDEVSMLSADTLAMADEVCREIMQKHEPFGGMQVVFVGDFFQLPPILPRAHMNEEKVVQLDFAPETSETPFAFRSTTWRRTNPMMCYLTEQYRQDDEDFLKILGHVRAGRVSNDSHKLLSSRVTSEDKAPKEIPRLYAHNVDVDRVNDARLKAIAGDEKSYAMKSEGAPPLIAALKRGCLSPESLKLKKGARVMFTKNSPDGSFVNGTLGEIGGFTNMGEPIVITLAGKRIIAEPMDWMINDAHKVLAQVTQIPLRLAWAVTIHKSQGMTLDAAVIDLSMAFEYGQGYVALSRVRSLDGLYLLGLNERALEVHPEILEQDIGFQTNSLEAHNAFDEMTEAEHEKLSRAFVKFVGGNPDGGVTSETMSPKVSKVNTRDQTLAMIQEGKDISEIARARKLKPSTIITHILELHHSGDVDRTTIELIIPSSLSAALPTIHAAFDKKGTETLTPVFKYLKGKHSYEDLRLARLLMD